jgi:Hint domain
MSGTVITNSYASLVILTGPDGDPATITSAATLSGGLSASSYGSAWTITNSGQILGSGVGVASGGTVANYGGILSTGSYGVNLMAGGSVSNASGGIIGGGKYGVFSQQGGYVTNASGGKIYGVNIGIAISNAGGTVINSGYVTDSASYVPFANYTGVDLMDGGSVTNTQEGTITGTNYGIRVDNAQGTVTNFGSIEAPAGNAIYLNAGGFLTNESGAYIRGANHGIVSNAAATITNDANATIANGNGGIYVYGGAGIVINAGIIGGNFDGVHFFDGGSVTNAAGGTITGDGYGIYIGSQAGTVSNAAGITGSQYAVKFAAGYDNLLTIDPGATFTGIVAGDNGNGAANISILELATGTSAGMLSGIGSQYTGFDQVTIDSNASWSLSGGNSLGSAGTLANAGTLTLSGGTLTDDGALANNGGILLNTSTLTAGPVTGTGSITIGNGSTLIVTGTVVSTEIVSFATTAGAFYLAPGTGANFAGTIGGFATGDTISLTGVTDASSTATIVNGNTLQVTSVSLGDIDLTLQPNPLLSTATFNVTETGGNAVITATDLPCFVAGTRIDTPEGPVAVEALRAGDLVLTAAGGRRPVRWIGRRHLNLRRHPNPMLARPIRVLANAVADGVPRHDLLISPDHALFIGGLLIPARLLLNGGTVRRDDQCVKVTYYHVELDTHDVLLAEGMPAESYLDTGNRGTFENAGSPLTLHPDMSNSQSRREAASSAPFAADADRVEPIWQQIARRARTLGHTIPDPCESCEDPSLRIEIGGRRYAPIAVDNRRWLFALPARTDTPRLVSLSGVPSEERPWIEERRRLGVMVSRITLSRGQDVSIIPLDHPGMARGWWDVEGDGETMGRWTDGDAALPIQSDQPALLEVLLTGAMAYPAVGHIDRASDLRGAVSPSNRRSARPHA